ncbi:speedy protein E18-like isoform X2 [Hylobates moloch]|uniref:speedy protein E18-like isoform X2 n=1 Tax=Hylobates moloch TaxID=81572 RepID=UPI002674DEEE|nr:speedy protein E18-like isoform X2 [Hylobates moloch]
MTSEIPTFLIGRSGLCRRLELSVQKKAMDRTETRFRKRGKIMGKITTSRQPHPQDEQSPQRSTSGYPLQEVVDDEVSGPSAPGVDPSPPCRSLCWQRKREWLDECKEEPERELAPEPEETWVVETLCGLKMRLKQQRVSPMLPEHHEDLNRLLAPGVDHSPPGRSLCWKRKREWPDESEESSSEEPQKEPAPEPEETWVVETLCGLKMKLKRRRVSLVLPEHHEAFNRLLEDPVIKRFLAWDKDLRVSDKVVWDLSPWPQSGRSPEAPGPSTLSSLGQFSAWHTKDPPDTSRPRHTPSKDPIGAHHPGSITENPSSGFSDLHPTFEHPSTPQFPNEYSHPNTEVPSLTGSPSPDPHSPSPQSSSSKM